VGGFHDASLSPQSSAANACPAGRLKVLRRSRREINVMFEGTISPNVADTKPGSPDKSFRFRRLAAQAERSPYHGVKISLAFYQTGVDGSSNEQITLLHLAEYGAL